MATGVQIFLIADVEWAVVGVILALPALVVLRAFEIGQHVVIGPAGAAQVCPIVVVPAVAADIDHGVDGRTAAQSLAARLVPDAPVEPFLRDGVIHVVCRRIRDGEHAGGGDPHAVVAPARLQQADRLAVLRQPACDRAARTAPADNDNVEFVHVVSPQRESVTVCASPAIVLCVSGRSSPASACCRSIHRARIWSLVSRLPSCDQPGSRNR